MTLLKKDFIITPHLANHTQTIPHSVTKYSAAISCISFCLLAKSHNITNSPWIIDRGAADHVVRSTHFSHISLLDLPTLLNYLMENQFMFLTLV